MNRRSFLKALVSIPLAAQLPDIPVHTNPLKDIVWTEAQLAFYQGIPYHCSNASTGQWLGISRAGYVKKELIELITKLEEDKKK